MIATMDLIDVSSGRGGVAATARELGVEVGEMLAAGYFVRHSDGDVATAGSERGVVFGDLLCAGMRDVGLGGTLGGLVDGGGGSNALNDPLGRLGR